MDEREYYRSDSINLVTTPNSSLKTLNEKSGRANQKKNVALQNDETELATGDPAIVKMFDEEFSSTSNAKLLQLNVCG